LAHLDEGVGSPLPWSAWVGFVPGRAWRAQWIERGAEVGGAFPVEQAVDADLAGAGDVGDV
jgi:hypothetical protein